MRTKKVSAICVALAATLFAGCSSAQGTNSIPASATAEQATVQSAGVSHWTYPHQKFANAKDLLKLQAEGKIVSPLTLAASKSLYNKVLTTARPTFRKVASGDPTMWLSNTGYSYLIGLNGHHQTVAAIDVSKNGCYSQVTIKIDHPGNLWLACQLNPSFESGAAQEYDSSGNLLTTYSVGCPTNIAPSSCGEFFSGTTDQTESNSNVFVGLTYYAACDASYNCTSANGGGVEYWKTGHSTDKPTLNTFNVPGVTLSGSGYLESDASGNIYYTYNGCLTASPSTCGYGLAEYANATNPSGTQTMLLPPGSIGTFGGVTISKNGKVLSVVDQIARTVTQYALPWTGTPLRTLGPTLTPPTGQGDPVSGGFNRNDSKMIIGDAYGWVNGITVKSNANKMLPTFDCAGGCQGAAYTPSDK